VNNRPFAGKEVVLQSIRIPSLIVIALLSLPGSGEAAQGSQTSPTASEPTVESTLSPVEVTATRLPDVKEAPSKVPTKIVVIDAEEIEKLGAKTVQEVLQYQSGIVMYDSVGNEFQQTVDLRGFNGQPVPGVTVFYDGVRVNEPDFNTINFDLIPIEDIEKIEIIYGPATVFGSNALAGVINITTKKGAQDQWRIAGEAAGGSYFRQRYRFATDGTIPDTDLDFNFGVTRELTDGWRQDTPARSTRIYSRVGYDDGDGSVNLAYTHVDDKINQGGSITQQEINTEGRRFNATPGDFTQNNYDLIALNARRKLSHGFSMAFNTFYRYRENTLFTVGRPFAPGFDPPEFLSRSTYRQGGGTAQLTHETKFFGRGNLFNFGVDYRYNQYDNTTSRSFTADNNANENAVGVFFVDTFDLFETLSISAGLRYDWDQIDFTDNVTPAFSFEETFNRVSPKAGIVYNPFDTLGFYFNFSEGFRPPTVNEFQGFGPPPLFQPFITELDPVTSRNFEIGARWKLPPWLEATLSLFYMPVKDEILFVVTDPATFTGQNVNVPDTLRRGIEVSLRGRYRDWADGFINYTVTKATFETDLLLFSGQVRKGDEFPLVPRYRVGFGLNVYPTEGLTVSLAGTFVSSQFLLNDEPNNAPKLDQYFVLNSRIAYTWKQATAFFTINNMTNTKYNTFGVVGAGATEFFVPAPTTTVFAGVKLQFDLLETTD